MSPCPVVETTKTTSSNLTSADFAPEISMPTRRTAACEGTDKIDSVELFHAALEMQAPTYFTQLFGQVLRVARLGSVQDQGGPVDGGHEAGSAAQARARGASGQGELDAKLARKNEGSRPGELRSMEPRSPGARASGR